MTVCETKLSTMISHLHGGGGRKKRKKRPSVEQMTSHVTWSDPTSGPPLVGSEADKRVMMTHEFFNQIKRGSDRSGRQSFRSRCIHPCLSNDSAPVADAIFASTAASGSRTERQKHGDLRTTHSPQSSCLPHVFNYRAHTGMCNIPCDCN